MPAVAFYDRVKVAAVQPDSGDRMSSKQAGRIFNENAYPPCTPVSEIFPYISNTTAIATAEKPGMGDDSRACAGCEDKARSQSKNRKTGALRVDGASITAANNVTAVCSQRIEGERVGSKVRFPRQLRPRIKNPSDQRRSNCCPQRQEPQQAFSARCIYPRPHGLCTRGAQPELRPALAFSHG